MQAIHYNDYQALIHDLAWRYHRLLNTEQEDLFSEGNIVFCLIQDEWNASKGAFSTFLTTSIINHFKTLRNKNRRSVVTVNGDVPIGSNELTPERSAEFWSTISSLSKEAQEMVDIVISGPSEVCQISSLKTHFREAGWAWRTIWNSVEEIKSIFH